MQKEVITVVTAFLLLSPGMAAQHGSFSYSIDKPWLTEVYVDDYYYGADSIGQCLMRVDYAMEIMVDTVQGTAVEQMMVLEIGNNVSRFCSTVYLGLDSLLQSGASRTMYRSIYNKVKYAPAFYSMFFQNYPRSGKLTCTGRVCNTDFKYEEDLPEMDWKIQDETDTLLGYMVQKAVCSFRGRDYTAWFAPQLPMQTGPWKFSALPGLILKVEDSRGHYTFIARGIYLASGAVEVPRYLFLKTSRRKYMDALYMSMTELFRACKLYLRDIEIRVSDPSALVKMEMMFDFMER